jgi:hypothetical protein
MGAQTMLSRGDRRLTDVLISARAYGDSLGSFRRAFNDHQGTVPPLEHYVHRDLDPGDGSLPWQHLQGPLPEGTLMVHHAEATALMVARDEEKSRQPHLSTKH